MLEEWVKTTLFIGIRNSVKNRRTPLAPLVATVLTAEEQAGTGVTPDCVRLSIAIEDVENIKADIQQALEASQQ